MTRAHLYRPVVDNQGNVLPNAIVRVLQPGTTTPISDTMYVDDTSGVTRSNPHTYADGVIDFYVEDAQRVRLGIKIGSGTEVFYEDVDILEPATGGGGGDILRVVPASGAAQTIPEPTIANINKILMTDDCTFTFPPGEVGKEFILALEQDGPFPKAPTGVHSLPLDDGGSIDWSTYGYVTYYVTTVDSGGFESPITENDEGYVSGTYGVTTGSVYTSWDYNQFADHYKVYRNDPSTPGAYLYLADVMGGSTEFTDDGTLPGTPVANLATRVGRHATWPSEVINPPDLVIASGAVDWLRFICFDGTNWVSIGARVAGLQDPNGNIVIGKDALAIGQSGSSIVFGKEAEVSSNGPAVAMGRRAKVRGNGAWAIGDTAMSDECNAGVLAADAVEIVPFGNYHSTLVLHDDYGDRWDVYVDTMGHLRVGPHRESSACNPIIG
jgi:hypothetical protein